MKIDVELIDTEGGWHKKTANSKSLLLKWLESLPKEAEIRWRGKRNIFVSLQYIKEEERDNFKN
ncbi:unnamed protein product [marine sediment metagenome]|uniref:Uncharacterized protein n=1 Tax=marine sediment metagenome TaxID=412755 RepID=X1REM5_9ZZZZ